MEYQYTGYSPGKYAKRNPVQRLGKNTQKIILSPAGFWLKGSNLSL